MRGFLSTFCLAFNAQFLLKSLRRFITCLRTIFAGCEYWKRGCSCKPSFHMGGMSITPIPLHIIQFRVALCIDFLSQISWSMYVKYSEVFHDQHSDAPVVGEYYIDMVGCCRILSVVVVAQLEDILMRPLRKKHQLILRNGNWGIILCFCSVRYLWFSGQEQWRDVK